MTLIFNKSYLPLIRSGEKTQTRRTNKPSLRVGRSYRLRIDFFSFLPDRILITRIFPQRLGSISLSDVTKEGFGSKAEFIAAISGIYGSISPDDELWVVEFKYIGFTDTFKQDSSGCLLGNRPKGVGPTRSHSELGS